MGADSMIDFHKWDFFKEIFKEINIIIGDREDYIHQAMRSKTALFFNESFREYDENIKFNDQKFWFLKQLKGS